MHKKFNNERRGRDISFCYLLDNREIQYLFILTHVALWNGSTRSLKIAYEGIHLRETCGRKSWKNNLMSCYKYSHWDPFMNVNPKYHRQGVRLSLSASLLFEAAWKIQRSIVGFWCHPPINDVTLNASIILDVIEHCKYLTKTIFIVRAASTCQLIVNWPTFRAMWLQYAPELSKEFDCEGKWDGSISPTKTLSL